MPSIFISYRRSDSQADAGRIYDRLAAHFGKEAVFKDVDDIPAGADFRDFLNRTLNECKVLLAIIGPTWLSAADDQGIRRLDNPADWVRIEIEEALRRKDVIIVPLLVSNARMPKVDELPDDIREFAYRNSREARPDPDFNKDMNRLMIGLEQYFEQTRQTEQPVVEPRIDACQLALDQQPPEKYRQEVRQYLQEDNGELTPVSRNLLDALRDFFGLSAEAAMAVEQDELKPYQAKAAAVARYQKVFSDALEYENPPSPETRSRLQRFQQTLGLDSDEAQTVETAIMQLIEQQQLAQHAEADRQRQATAKVEQILQEQAAATQRQLDAVAERQRQTAEVEERLKRLRRTQAAAAREHLQPQTIGIEPSRQPVAPPISTQPYDPTTMSRQQFLKWGGLGSLGLIAAFSINQIFDRPPWSVDYTRLKELLKAGEWQDADQETLAVMLKIANREDQGWLDSESIRNFSCDALAIIDQLWVDASGGKFGFSVQKKIYINDCGGQPDGQYDEIAWYCFADKVGWRVNGNWLTYSQVTFNTAASAGHLPHILRGGGWEFGWWWWAWACLLVNRLVKCGR